MSQFRRCTGFLALLVISGLFVVAAAIWLGWEIRAEKTARQRLQVVRKKARDLAGMRPSLTIENRRAMEAELRALSGAWREARAEFQVLMGPRKQADGTAPVERADGYFDIARFVERMRVLADERGVKTAADERFGFAEYAHGGPEVEDLNSVYAERCAAETLLSTLLNCAPTELIEVRREPLRRGGEAKGGVDGFVWEPSRALRRAKIIESFALRVTFVGQTVTLRTLLNRLASRAVPAVVRSVEVELAPPAMERRPVAEHVADEMPPLVTRSPSRFTVTVEFVDFVADEPAEFEG